MSERDKLMRLADFLVEYILAATDAEIMSEEAEDAAATAAPEPILDIPCMTLKERFPPESFNRGSSQNERHDGYQNRASPRGAA